MIVLYETLIIFIIIIYHSIVALHLVGAPYANHTYIVTTGLIGKIQKIVDFWEI